MNSNYNKISGNANISSG